MPEVWLDKGKTITRAAVVEGRKLVGLEVDNEVCTPRAGARYVAKVMRFNPDLGIAEMDLGGTQAFLSLKRRAIEPGKLVVVEWQAPATGNKQAVVKLLPKEQASGKPRLLEDGPDALARTGLAVTREGDFELIDLESQIDALLQRVVPLPDGGSLVFDTTEVGHMIDINGGSGKDINRIALPEVARQIRLRNLGGIILIDCVGSRRAGLAELLRAEVAADPCTVEVFGITKLGLIECTRVRRGYPLSVLLA